MEWAAQVARPPLPRQPRAPQQAPAARAVPIRARGDWSLARSVLTAGWIRRRARSRRPARSSGCAARPRSCRCGSARAALGPSSRSATAAVEARGTCGALFSCSSRSLPRADPRLLSPARPRAASSRMTLAWMRRPMLPTTPTRRKRAARSSASGWRRCWRSAAPTPDRAIRQRGSRVKRRRPQARRGGAAKGRPAGPRSG